VAAAAMREEWCEKQVTISRDAGAGQEVSNCPTMAQFVLFTHCWAGIVCVSISGCRQGSYR